MEVTDKVKSSLQCYYFHNKNSLKNTLKRLKIKKETNLNEAITVSTSRRVNKALFE